MFARFAPQRHGAAKCIISASRDFSSAASSSVLKQCRSTIPRSACRVQDALRQQRSLHTIPMLANQTEYEELGIGKLYSREGFRMAWTERQMYLVNNYNELVAGTKWQDEKTFDVVINTARQAEYAAIFNHASALVNNHFFFETLRPRTQEEKLRPAHISRLIQASFENYGNLRKTMLATAMACFSNAFVWLVMDNDYRLRVFTTYNAGTPYGAAYRRQSHDANTTEPEIMRDVTAGVTAAVRGGRWAEDPVQRILLCVNVWEHAWLMNFGIGGKARYLNTWWDHIDWEVVGTRVPDVTASHPPRMR